MRARRCGSRRNAPRRLPPLRGLRRPSPASRNSVALRFGPAWRGFGIFAKDDENLSNLLNGLRARPQANLSEQRIAGVAIRAGGAELDQLVAFQAAVDLGKDRRRQSRGADQDHRLQGMGARLQLAPLNRG
jgi:hypothetical protein